MKWLKENGRKPTQSDAKIIMSNNVGIRELAIQFGQEIQVQLLDEIMDDLEFELKTIELYKDTVSTLQNLKELGSKIALCSNLAMPYGEELRKILPNLFDVVIFSYEVGLTKPEKRMYELIQERLACQMSDMLFIGDHPILDVETPISLGMSARLIERGKNQSLKQVLNGLIKK